MSEKSKTKSYQHPDGLRDLQGLAHRYISEKARGDVAWTDGSSKTVCKGSKGARVAEEPSYETMYQWLLLLDTKSRVDERNVCRRSSRWLTCLRNVQVEDAGRQRSRLQRKATNLRSVIVRTPLILHLPFNDGVPGVLFNKIGRSLTAKSY